MKKYQGVDIYDTKNEKVADLVRIDLSNNPFGDLVLVYGGTLLCDRHGDLLVVDTFEKAEGFIDCLLAIGYI